MIDQTLRRGDELLTELIEIVETARAVPMSTSCVLPRERVLDLLDELREVTPPELEEARRVLTARDALLREAHEIAVGSRERAVAEADTVLADANNRIQTLVREAHEQAEVTIQAGHREHARLVTATSVHEGAAESAARLRAQAEDYAAKVCAQARHYDAGTRAAADGFAHDTRAEAEAYATKLSADAERYVEQTLDELGEVLRRSAATAEQGRAALAQRRATGWVAETRPDDGSEHAAGRAERPPISA